MKNLVEAYKDVLQLLCDHLKVVSYDCFKKIPLEKHKQIFREFFERNPQEEINVLNETLACDRTSVINGFIEIAKDNLMRKFDVLKEKIIQKVSNKPNVPHNVDFIIDVLLIYETLSLIYDEQFAKDFVKNLVEAKKNMEETTCVLRKLRIIH